MIDENQESFEQIIPVILPYHIQSFQFREDSEKLYSNFVKRD